VSPADVGLPFWPALEGSQVDRSVAPAAYFIARINHESKSFFVVGQFEELAHWQYQRLAIR
jgi:hypothetical protein